MTASWLTYQSFQRSQEVLQAINSLSTYLKLKLSGNLDQEHRRAVDQSVEILRKFLDVLEAAARQVDGPQAAPMLGVDPRLQQLAHSFLRARRQERFCSPLFTEPIAEIGTLLSSEDRSDQKALVACLAELRVLVEEHMDDDVNNVLGTI